jgi:2-iminoacetate synthase
MGPIDTILNKARKGNGLSLDEVSFLFENITSKNINNALEVAIEVRNSVKGKVTSLYTCLYITNFCLNDCSYCGFRKSNSDLLRKTLTIEQIREEAKTIKKSKVSSAIIIGGTLPEEVYKEIIIKSVKICIEEGLVPWIEFENLSKENLEALYKAGARHFVLFQETYNPILFDDLHKNNDIKSSFKGRMKKVDEAIDVGFENIGIGALFGLSKDYLTEVRGIYIHASSLLDKGLSVCINIPTLKKAKKVILKKVPNFIIEKLFIILKLALPNASLALSGREDQNLRNRLFKIVDQVGSGGTPNPGGRTTFKENYLQGDTQFSLSDKRSPKEVISYLKVNKLEIIEYPYW